MSNKFNKLHHLTSSNCVVRWDRVTLWWWIGWWVRSPREVYAGPLHCFTVLWRLWFWLVINITPLPPSPLALMRVCPSCHHHCYGIGKMQNRPRASMMQIRFQLGWIDALMVVLLFRFRWELMHWWSFTTNLKSGGLWWNWDGWGDMTMRAGMMANLADFLELGS